MRSPNYKNIRSTFVLLNMQTAKLQSNYKTFQANGCSQLKAMEGDTLVLKLDLDKFKRFIRFEHKDW